MSDFALRVEGLSKQFRIGSPEGYRTLRESLTDVLTAPFRRLHNRASGKSGAETIWALKDVSFEVKHGEVIGIIGRNGAGKSTLLKILSRITGPTEGHAEIHGRVGSLLEVGTGFHPELTGRENIFLNGAILGMKNAEILRKFDEIVAFAEVDKFIDTPVKHYSSGMYVRLAFAVAAHMETDILIVDEVLGVGDVQFQKKCLGKMDEVANVGRTVLFVSHNMGMVSKLCRTGVLLECGRLVKAGGVDDVIQDYLRAAAGSKSSRFVAPPTQENIIVRILQAETMNDEEEATSEFGHDDSVRLKIDCALDCSDPDLLASTRLTVCLVDGVGRRVFTDQTSIPRHFTSRTGFSAAVGIPAGLLTPGNYTFIINANIPPSEILHRVEDVCPFSIMDLGTEFAMFKGGDLGCIFARCDWRVTPAGLLPDSLSTHLLK